MRRAPEWLVLTTLFLVVFATASQFLIVAPLLPEIGVKLGIADELLGTLVSGYAVMVGVFALLAGPISDRVGRRTILRVGSLVMAGALALHVVAWDYASMVLVRGFAGAASGILSGAAAAYVGDVFPYERRGAALGWVMSGMAFGQILGIPAGTLIAGPLGFQAPFVVFGAVMLVAWALTLVALPPAPVPEREPLSVGSALADYVALLRRGDVFAVAVSGTLMMVGVSCYMVYLPAWMERELGSTNAGIALLFGVGGVANGLAGPLAGKLSDRIGRKGLIVIGGMGLAAVQGLTVLSPSEVGLIALFALGMGLASMRMSPLNALLTAMVPPSLRGTLLSLTMATSQTGFAIGSAVAGWMYGRWGYGGDVIVAAAASFVGALLVALWVPEPVNEPIVVG